MKECVQCGYCCTKAACGFGEWDKQKHRCIYLTGETQCSIYSEIIRDPSSIVSPAFGAGCCMSLFNSVREAKALELRQQGKDVS